MIKLIRLVSGEEIIAETKHEESNPDSIHIKDAIILIPAGEGKIGIMPFMPYTEASKGLELRTQDIMFMVDPVDTLVTQFKSARSGIVTAPKRILS
jgi:hypothetical protein